MNIPNDLRYSKSHEWIQTLPDGRVRIGLTDHAQSELGDLVFINLPAVGDALTVGKTFADVESVKAVSDIYSPVSGTVTAVNEAVLDDAAIVNENCYDAWLVEIGEIQEEEELIDSAAYETLLKEGA